MDFLKKHKFTTIKNEKETKDSLRVSDLALNSKRKGEGRKGDRKRKNYTD